LQFYVSAHTTLNELLAVFLYIIFVVLLKFERSLNSYFVHNNNNYYYYLPATSLQNCMHLRQSAAEILLFVQKSKMATAILDFIFVQYFGSFVLCIHAIGWAKKATQENVL